MLEKSQDREQQFMFSSKMLRLKHMAIDLTSSHEISHQTKLEN